jgi:hypothetical protein
MKSLLLNRFRRLRNDNVFNFFCNSSLFILHEACIFAQTKTSFMLKSSIHNVISAIIIIVVVIIIPALHGGGI